MRNGAHYFCTTSAPLISFEAMMLRPELTSSARRGVSKTLPAFSSVTHSHNSLIFSNTSSSHYNPIFFSKESKKRGGGGYPPIYYSSICISDPGYEKLMRTVSQNNRRSSFSDPPARTTSPETPVFATNQALFATKSSAEVVRAGAHYFPAPHRTALDERSRVRLSKHQSPAERLPNER